MCFDKRDCGCSICARALEYFLRAAESSDPEWAPYAYLSVYELSHAAQGDGSDDGQADEWKEKFLKGETALAEAGLPKAGFLLAYAYYNGIISGEPDHAAALTWFRKAADAGHEKAAERLAELTGAGSRHHDRRQRPPPLTWAERRCRKL